MVHFDRDADSGRLTHKETLYDETGLVVDGLDGTTSVVLSPDGRYLYAGRLGDNAICIFHRSLTTGYLLFEGFVQEGVDDVEALAVSPEGRHYATDFENHSISIYGRDASTGLLSYEGKVQEGPDGVPDLDAPYSSPLRRQPPSLRRLAAFLEYLFAKCLYRSTHVDRCLARQTMAFLASRALPPAPMSAISIRLEPRTMRWPSFVATAAAAA